MDAVSAVIQTTIAGYAAQLAADAASAVGQPSYSLDGKSVSRNEWRTGIQKLIDDLQNTINARNPTITWRQVGGRGYYGS